MSARGIWTLSERWVSEGCERGLLVSLTFAIVRGGLVVGRIGGWPEGGDGG